DPEEDRQRVELVVRGQVHGQQHAAVRDHLRASRRQHPPDDPACRPRKGAADSDERGAPRGRESPHPPRLVGRPPGTAARGRVPPCRQRRTASVVFSATAASRVMTRIPRNALSTAVMSRPTQSVPLRNGSTTAANTNSPAIQRKNVRGEGTRLRNTHSSAPASSPPTPPMIAESQGSCGPPPHTEPRS